MGMVGRQARLRANEMDGEELHDAAEYLRGKIRPVPANVSDVSNRRARRAHLDWYRQTRRNALALWLETVDMHDLPTNPDLTSSTTACRTSTSASATAEGDWPDDGETKAPCLLWCSGRWHCASAGWSEYPEKEKLKVVFAGYDVEDAVFVHPQDARIRQAVLDPRCGRDQPNHQVLKGVFPKEGDCVRIHVVDAAEARVFLQQGVYLAGVVTSPLAAHDSCIVNVAGLAGTEQSLLVVPNTRMENVSAQEFTQVVEGLKVARNQVLRQLDIATSQTIAIRVVSGVGEVVDDRVEVSIWALGDQMLIRVWQRKGEFMLETSVPASDSLAAVGLEDTGLTVLSEAEREQLLHGVRGRLRLFRGRLTMEMEIGYTPGRRDTQHHTESEISAEIYQETHPVEGVSVETIVEPAGYGGILHVRSKTLPPGPERVYELVAQPKDWADLGYPSLPWLNSTRASSLGQELTRCVKARDGSLVLQIGRQILRSQDWFPIPPSLGGSSSERARSRPQAATSKTRGERSGNQNVHNDASSCVSGAPPGLCSCRIVLKKGVSLPLSITESTAAAADTDINNNDNNTPASSGSRWLVMVKATGEKLTLSLIQPSRRALSSSSRPSTTTATSTGLRTKGTSGASRACKLHEQSKKRAVRRSLSLVATRGDWASLGYGPLQWMSHEQKAFIARLSLYWVSMSPSSPSPKTRNTAELIFTRNRTQDRTIEEVVPGSLSEEVYLRFQPVVSSLTRPVGSSRETVAWAASRGDGRNIGGTNGSGRAAATPEAENHARREETTTRSRVLVRDEGGVFRVEVARAGWDGGVSHRQRGPTMLEKTFGKEAWQPTGLGELLWLDCSSRQYLAHRLAQQVAFTAAAEGDSRDERHNYSDTGDSPATLFIVSDLPLPYWRGTITIARLGSHAEGVFVRITDAGRRLLIEAEDFEGGPRLASSMVSLEAWTSATGMVTLRPPTDSHSFKKILEDQLAALLGAGFRSRTSRLEKKRLIKGMQEEERRGRRWRGTFLQLSEMEKGEIGKLGGEDSESDTGDAETPPPGQKSQSSLPPVSPRDLTPLEQKRALRLEMLTRMIEEFHGKHGRRHRGGVEKRQNKVVGLCVPDAPVSATTVDPGGQNHDPTRRGPAAFASDTGKSEENGRGNTNSTTTTKTNNTDNSNHNGNNGNRSSSTSNDPSSIPLPVIAPSAPHDPQRRSNSITEGTSTLSPRRSTPNISSQDHPAVPAKDVSGSSVDRRGDGSNTTPLHICVCCGGEGGRGHGRLCEHIFRRCGFCRVEEVKRVLGIKDPRGRGRRDRRESGPHRTAGGVPALLLSKDGGSGDVGTCVGEEEEEGEEEFEWVTDSEEEDPEFQCDSCGRVIGETEDRFHCETCSDHDLCQACFLSSRKATNGQQSVQEGGPGGGHLASHEVTRVMGKPAVPGR